MAEVIALPRSTHAAAPPSVAEIRREALELLTGPEAVAAWHAYRAGNEPDPRALYAILGRHGLLAPAWPRRYGGRGLTPQHQAAVVEALVHLGIAETLHTLSVQIVGMFLLTAGSRAQRALLLPDLAAGRSFATVLYSEPDVGSDLAALTTSAVAGPDGGWRLTGRKVYSIKTYVADVALIAARTSDESTRYQGLTLFLVPLATPGVRVHRLPSLADEDFADVEFDDVRVADSAVVGSVGGAWPLITEALALERTGIDYYAKASTWMRLWREYAREGGVDAGQLVDAARLSAKVEASRLFADRCLTQLASGRVDPVLAAVTKLWCADTAREVAWWCADESGAQARFRPPPLAVVPRQRTAGRTPDADGADDDRADSVLAGFGLAGFGLAGLERIESAYREAPGLTISAGTAEMMLEVIAGSGLPGLDMDLIALAEEPFARALRASVRDIAGAYDDRDDSEAWWAELARIEAFALDVPAERGGLGLGLEAAVVVCEEMGRGGLDEGLLDTLTTIDALASTPGTASGQRLHAACRGAYRAVVVGAHPSAPVVWPEYANEGLCLPDGAGDASVPSGVHACLRGPGEAGEERLGLAIDPTRLRDRDRVRRAAWLTGLATGALSAAVQRARDRHQFGKALVEHQAIAFRLARLTADVTATRLLVDTASTRVGAGAVAGSLAAARSLASAGELAARVTREAMQICGAWGMTDAASPQRFYRAAHAATALIGPLRRLWHEAAAGDVEFRDLSAVEPHIAEGEPHA